MALDFLPFQEGQKLTADDLNELVDAIQDGTIFDAGNVTGQLVTGLAERVLVLEGKVSVLEERQNKIEEKEQFAITASDTLANLAFVPLINSEDVYLNGQLLAKKDLPAGFAGSYTISGSVISFEPSLQITLTDDDVMIVKYERNI